MFKLVSNLNWASLYHKYDELKVLVLTYFLAYERSVGKVKANALERFSVEPS